MIPQSDSLILRTVPKALLTWFAVLLVIYCESLSEIKGGSTKICVCTRETAPNRHLSVYMHCQYLIRWKASTHLIDEKLMIRDKEGTLVTFVPVL